MTICLDRMSMDGQWPMAVLGDEFRPEREAVRKAIQAALEEDKQGELAPDTVAAVQTAINQLRAKFERLVPQASPDYIPAHWQLKAMDGITKMLYSPAMDKVLSELEDYQGATLGDLLGFMQAFNLRFGEARSYRQRLIYQRLYPMLADQANSIASPGTASVTAAAATAANDVSAAASSARSTVASAGSAVVNAGGQATAAVATAGGDAFDELKSAAINFFKGWGK